MSEAKELSRSAIINRPVSEPVKFEVPEWGGHVYLKPLTVKERDKYENSLFDKKGRPNMKGSRARLLIMSVVNRNGLPVFKRGDEDIIDEMGAAGVDRVSKRVMELCGMSEEDIEAEAEVFDEAHGDDSSSE